MKPSLRGFNAYFRWRRLWWNDPTSWTRSSTTGIFRRIQIGYVFRTCVEQYLFIGILVRKFKTFNTNNLWINLKGKHSPGSHWQSVAEVVSIVSQPSNASYRVKAWCLKSLPTIKHWKMDDLFYRYWIFQFMANLPIHINSLRQQLDLLSSISGMHTELTFLVHGFCLSRIAPTFCLWKVTFSGL